MPGFTGIYQDAFLAIIEQFNQRTFLNANVVVLRILFRCQWKDKGLFRGRSLKRGEFPYGVHEFSRECGISPQELRTVLDRLEEIKFLTNESTNQGSKGSVIDFDTYVCASRSNQQANQQATNEKQTNQQTNQQTKSKGQVVENKRSYKDRSGANQQTNQQTDLLQTNNTVDVKEGTTESQGSPLPSSPSQNPEPLADGGHKDVDKKSKRDDYMDAMEAFWKQARPDTRTPWSIFGKWRTEAGPDIPLDILQQVVHSGKSPKNLQAYVSKAVANETQTRRQKRIGETTADDLEDLRKEIEG